MQKQEPPTAAKNAWPAFPSNDPTPVKEAPEEPSNKDESKNNDKDDSGKDDNKVAAATGIGAAALGAVTAGGGAALLNKGKDSSNNQQSSTSNEVESADIKETDNKILVSFLYLVLILKKRKVVLIKDNNRMHKPLNICQRVCQLQQ